MLSIHQKLTQQQRLTPQQIQFQKLLQLNLLALEQRMKDELELNPMLEEVADLEIEQLSDTPEQTETIQEDDPIIAESISDSDEPPADTRDDEFNAEDYLNEGDFDDSDVLPPSYGDDDQVQPVARARESLNEHLLDQLYMLDISEPLVALGEEIIGNIDNDGYLIRTLEEICADVALFRHITVSAEEAELLLHKIQTFDPAGIASRNLQECLLIQIRASSFDPYYSYLAEELLKNHFESFIQKRYDAILIAMDLTQETLRSVIDIIKRLNPKPGEGNIQDEALNQITPDFVIEKVDEDYIITLNDRSLPSVTLSKTYLDMLKEAKGVKHSPREKDAYRFLKDKHDSAVWFLNCIKQRKMTLEKVMRTIFERQYEFFEFGPKHLKPMIYKDIADDIQMDISTVSRVVNGKFVQSPMGIHELKYFFSEGLATDSGEEVSNKHIKERIKEIIENEPRKIPLSDDHIAAMLQNEGIHIARRTVAKYRESLRIPIARLRKRL